MKKLKKADRGKRRPLTLEDRQYILKMRDLGLGIREISRKIGRNHSVISRFLKSIPYSPYLSRMSAYELALLTHQRAKEKRKQSRKKQRLKSQFIRNYVEEKLELGWTPEIIAGRLALEHPELKTNHESIYKWIYCESRELIKYLPISGANKRRRRSSGRKRRAKQPAAPKKSIELRPKSADSREEAGHWEGDTLVSKSNTYALFNLVERKSRFMVLQKIPDLTAKSGYTATCDGLINVPQELLETLTFDNGSENSDHSEIEEDLKIEVYFCHPYTASERGTVENRNKFIRKYFPKKTDFKTISEDEIKRVQDIHNNRPMKCLQFKTPLEVFMSEVEQVTNSQA